MAKVCEYLEKFVCFGGLVPLAALCLLTAPSATSAAPRAVCAPYEIPIELEFTTEIPGPAVHTAGAAEIAAMARAGGIEDPANHPSGVTVVETRLALDSRSFAVRSHPSEIDTGESGECIYLDKVVASFGWRAHDIYVAGYLTPGSCRYEAVLRHERKHAAINDQALLAFAPQVKAALEDAIAREVPIFEKSAGTATKDVIARLDASVAMVLAAFEREKAQRHAVIDSPEQRLAEMRACESAPKPRKPRVHVIPE